ncbi:MAG: hypothetical protein HYU63_00630 [Armatimonadetes bacterium]|nr:hypothetical protein [Armatimonadota bacterium]
MPIKKRIFLIISLILEALFILIFTGKIAFAAVSVAISQTSTSFTYTLTGSDALGVVANNGLTITASSNGTTGWKLQIKNAGTDFTSGGNTIANANFKFDSTAVTITRNSGQAIDPLNGPIVDIVSGSFPAYKKFAHANLNYGKGNYTVTVPTSALTLDIPAQTRAGAYSGPTITITIYTGP